MADVLEEIATYLTAQSHLGGASGWVHAIGFMPDSPDKLLGLFRFGGRFPIGKDGLERPGVQLRVRAGDYATASAKAVALFDLLRGVEPAAITGVRYMHAVGSPNWLGQDSNNRPEFSINFDAGVSR